VRKLIIALALTTALAGAAVSSGAVPRAGVRFTGTTSAKEVNGFGDSITFLTGAKSLKSLSFGTLGCFGYGSFPVGVDAYAISLAQLRASVLFTAKGTFDAKNLQPSWNGGDPGTKLFVNLTGAFTSPTAISGTITYSEKTSNGGTCGPSKMKFSAKPGSSSSP
jgi:hypothetical protein